MFLIRCKNDTGQYVLTAERYTWNWVKYHKQEEAEDFLEVPYSTPIIDGGYLGVIVAAKVNGLDEWESFAVGPCGYGQIIIEDANRRTRDNFRLKIYKDSEGLVTY